MATSHETGNSIIKYSNHAAPGEGERHSLLKVAYAALAVVIL